MNRREFLESILYASILQPGVQQTRELKRLTILR